MGLIESAGAILANGERRLESISQNISNASTPGFKRQIAFSQMVDGSNGVGDYRAPLTLSLDPSPGKLVESGNALDLAIAGAGMFMVRNGDQFDYIRSGQFSRSAEGAVIDANGRYLQQAGGGDLVLDAGKIEILEDGTVLLDGNAAGTVGLFHSSASNFVPLAQAVQGIDAGASAYDAPDGLIKQGFIEASNVVLADEMMHLMANNRQVEMGAQIIRTYDQLIGQAVTTFTRSGR